MSRRLGLYVRRFSQAHLLREDTKPPASTGNLYQLSRVFLDEAERDHLLIARNDCQNALKHSEETIRPLYREILEQQCSIQINPKIPPYPVRIMQNSKNDLETASGDLLRYGHDIIANFTDLEAEDHYPEAGAKKHRLWSNEVKRMSPETRQKRWEEMLLEHEADTVRLVRRLDAVADEVGSQIERQPSPFAVRRVLGDSKLTKATPSTQLESHKKPQPRPSAARAATSDEKASDTRRRREQRKRSAARKREAEHAEKVTISKESGEANIESRPMSLMDQMKLLEKQQSDSKAFEE